MLVPKAATVEAPTYPPVAPQTIFDLPQFAVVPAPVEVIEYASLTCHHCATFHTEILPQVKKELIDTGKVRLVYRDFPLDRIALEAATLARCVAPERYFPILTVLFSKQEDWSHAKDPVEALARIGTLAGLSRPAYDACRADKALQDSIVQSRFEAEQKHGVESTPSFVIGGKTYKGVLPLDQFKKAVEPLLPKS
jgi:protein-disulfide isomerase